MVKIIWVLLKKQEFYSVKTYQKKKEEAKKIFNFLSPSHTQSPPPFQTS